MNRIPAILVQLEHENGVTLIDAQASGHSFSAMLVWEKARHTDHVTRVGIYPQQRQFSWPRRRG